MSTNYIPYEDLSAAMKDEAHTWVRNDLMLEGSEVTDAMVGARVMEYDYAVTSAGLARNLKPEFQRGGAVAVPEADTKRKKAVDGMDKGERILQVGLEDLLPSPLNPRGFLAPDELPDFARAKELVSNGRVHEASRAPLRGRVEALLEMALTMAPPTGILQPLIVRESKEAPGKFEIVAGHRRWHGAQIAGLATAPVFVRDVSDETMLELMLIENLQREDLNALEEARGIASMLDFRDEEGKPKWTVETLAQKLGKTTKHVFNTLRILRVPSKYHGKIEDGSLGRTICYLIAAIPDVKLRAECAAEIVKGNYDGPYTMRGAQEHIRRNYMVELRGSPFDQKEAELVPVREEGGERCAGGACVTCPLNSANRKDDDDVEAGRTAMCMNPACYQSKVEAHVSAAMRKAEAAGDKVVTGEAAKKLLDWNGNIASGSGKVRLNEKPTGELVGGKKAPSWAKMLDGDVKAEVTTIIDPKGRTMRVVDRGQAIEAAKQNGFKDLFVAGASKKKVLAPDEEKAAKRRAEELAEQKLATATTNAWMAALVAHVTEKGISEAAWMVMLDLAIGHAGNDGRKWVINRRGIAMLKKKDKYRGEYADPEGALRSHGDTLSGAEIIALVVELMLAQGVRWTQTADDEFKAMLGACEIPCAKIEDEVKAQFAEKKKPKGKTAENTKDTDAAPPSAKELKELDALSRQMEALRARLDLPLGDLKTIAFQTLGRDHKTHGGEENFWHKGDYIATIGVLKKQAKDAKPKKAAKGKLTSATEAKLAAAMKERWDAVKKKMEVKI